MVNMRKPDWNLIDKNECDCKKVDFFLTNGQSI